VFVPVDIEDFTQHERKDVCELSDEVLDFLSLISREIQSYLYRLHIRKLVG
jgi:hypothetical protein